MKAAPLQDRFDGKYIPEPTSGCWLWEGPAVRNRTGEERYGLIGRGGKHGGMMLAHRCSWQLHCGEIPEGKWVLHKCDNGFCVNPDHLFIGTHNDNMADMSKKGRSTFGERNGQAKLTEEKARDAKHSTESIRACARRLGVSETTVSFIRKGQRWAHV